MGQQNNGSQAPSGEKTGSGSFMIRILEQGWLVPTEPDEDYCSHGKLRLVITGIEIENGGDHYGISESALALLRTLNCNHSKQAPVAERLIFHGCGNILMMGCPIGIDWAVEHFSGQVKIKDVIRYDTTTENDAILFPKLEAVVSFSNYRSEIIKFANDAKDLFIGTRKKFTDAWDRQQYQRFWHEYDSHLEKWQTAD
jgi:hypothetical protein